MAVSHTAIRVDQRTLPFFRTAARTARDYNYLSKNDLNVMNETALGSFVDTLVQNYDRLSADQKTKLRQIIRQSNKKDAIINLLNRKTENNARLLIQLINADTVPSSIINPGIIHPVEVMNMDIVDTIFVSSSSWNRNDSELVNRRTAEMNALFQGDNKEVSYNDLRRYLMNEAGWNDQAVVLLFSRYEKISRDQFIRIINNNVLAHNKRRNDTLYCQSIGVTEGTIFQQAQTFYRVDLNQARTFVEAVDRMYGNNSNSEIGRIVRRAKALDGNPNAWSDREIITAYLALAFRYKDEVIGNNNRQNNNSTEGRIGVAIDHQLLCEKYGINNDDLNDTRQVRNGQLNAYNGNPASDSNYVKWRADLTNDDYFTIRDLQGHTVRGLGLVDVNNLWILQSYNRRNNNNRGGTYIRAVTRIGGKYYEITIRDNRVRAGARRNWRYINGSTTNKERLSGN